MRYICEICGYAELEYPPWGEDGKNPSYNICPCCGVEFGYEDCTTESKLKYFNKWAESGYKWFKPEKKSKEWDLKKQLKNINKTPK